MLYTYFEQIRDAADDRGLTLDDLRDAGAIDNVTLWRWRKGRPCSQRAAERVLEAIESWTNGKQ